MPPLCSMEKQRTLGWAFSSTTQQLWKVNTGLTWLINNELKVIHDRNFSHDIQHNLFGCKHIIDLNIENGRKVFNIDIIHEHRGVIEPSRAELWNAQARLVKFFTSSSSTKLEKLGSSSARARSVKARARLEHGSIIKLVRAFSELELVKRSKKLDLSSSSRKARFELEFEKKLVMSSSSNSNSKKSSFRAWLLINYSSTIR